MSTRRFRDMSLHAGKHEVDREGWYVFDDFDVWGPYVSESDALDAGSLQAYESWDGGPLQVVYVIALPDAADMPRIMDERTQEHRHEYATDATGIDAHETHEGITT